MSHVRTDAEYREALDHLRQQLQQARDRIAELERLNAGLKTNWTATCRDHQALKERFTAMEDALSSEIARLKAGS